MALLHPVMIWFVAASLAASPPVPFIPFIDLPPPPLTEPAPARPCEVSLTGSACSLALQNTTADVQSLSRLRESELERLKASGVLVRLPEDETVRISPRLSERYRWCLPATRAFIVELSRRFYDRYGTPLQINSAVRTIERQQVLMRSNMNAARGETPERRSPHLTGSTIDIAKRGLTESQRLWLGAQLFEYERQGRVEATEEFLQAVFHVMVLR